MRAYVIRRILLVIPTLFIVTLLVFLSVRFIPGDIIDVMAARMTFSGSGSIDEEALKKRLGLDKPVYAQYAKWIGDIVSRGTLGHSRRDVGQHVTDERAQRAGSGRLRGLEVGVLLDPDHRAAHHP